MPEEQRFNQNHNNFLARVAQSSKEGFAGMLVTYTSVLQQTPGNVRQ